MTTAADAPGGSTPPGTVKPGCPRTGRAAPAQPDAARAEQQLARRAFELLPGLFQPFRQADESLHRSAGGLGLGLALVKGLVEMLPLLPDSSEPAKVQAQEPPASPGCRVLVIDDDHDCADTLREVLELGGHEVEVAYDGQEGVARFEALHPDVVFCDIGLPGLDGYEVARQIRRLDDDAPPTLIALSGYALPEDRRKALEAGFDYHLGKPLALDELEALLVRITRRA